IIGGVVRKELCFEFTDASLRQIIALTDICTLFIGNNTGPLRFADARNKKVVAICGPVDERVYGAYPAEPGRVRQIVHKLDCMPCYRNFRLSQCLKERECLSGISVDEVFDAARELLGQSEGAHSR
ncbi:MAG: glycosyltransferase family 9 protein, partial [Deltaproteobacteria bacterium]